MTEHTTDVEKLHEMIGRLFNIIDRCLDRFDRVVRKEETDCLCLLSRACDQHQAAFAAREWILQHLVPSDERQPVRALKHNVEYDCCRGHLTHSDFVSALVDAGYKVKGEWVFCTVVE
jgi:hypothetical protein